MESYATLRGVAPLILIRYLYLGGENESIDETMAALGVTNRNYFYRARGELYKLGLLTRDGKLPGLETPAPPPQTVPQRLPEIEPALEIDPVDEIIPTGSLLSRIVKADGMDDSGDRNRRTSPFHARRKVQVAVLQETFTHYWPEFELIEANAKTLLNLTGDCAEAVYEAFETASGRTLSGHPFAYVRGILRRQQEEERGPQVKPVNLERPDEDAPVKMIAPDPVLARVEAKARAKMPWLWEEKPDDD